MLNGTGELKQTGFDSGLLGYDDAEKDGAGETALDRFLKGIISAASARLEKWIGQYEDSPETRQAELILATVFLLPFAWSRSTIGTSNLTVEGMQITMARPSQEEKNAVLKSLLAQAEMLVKDRIREVSFGGVESHD